LPLVDQLFEPMSEIGKRARAGQIWTTVDLQIFADTSRAQIPEAISVLASALRFHGDSVLAGRERAVLLKPDQPAPKVVEPPAPATTKVFATKNIRWTDHKGRTQTSGKYLDVDLPPVIASRAHALGICRDVNDEFSKQKRATNGWARPLPEDCTSLDLEDSGATIVEFRPSDPRLTVVDRGGPFDVPIARGV
jgi:hypothetical protein